MSPAADVGIYEDKEEEEKEEQWVSWDPAARLGGGVFTLLAHPASCNASCSPTSNSTSGYQREIFFN